MQVDVIIHRRIEQRARINDVVDRAAFEQGAGRIVIMDVLHGADRNAQRGNGARRTGCGVQAAAQIMELSRD